MLTPSQIAEMADKKYPIHGGSLQEIICNLERKAYIAAFTDAMELMSKEWVSGTPPTAMLIIAGRWYKEEFLQDIIFYDGITSVFFDCWQPLPKPPEPPEPPELAKDKKI